MGECRTCPKEKRERPYKSVPRRTRYSSQTTNNTNSKPYRASGGDCYPVKNYDSCGLSLCKNTKCGTCLDACCVDPCLEGPRRCSPCLEPCLRRCNPCLDPCLDRPRRCSPCLERPRRCSPCNYPCQDWTGRCSPCADPYNYCPENTDSGVLHAIRNGFQRIFTGRKRNCAPMYKGKVYNYSSTQLKFMERQLDKLENEASCLESSIKDAFNCNVQVSCASVRCALTALAEKLDCLKGDLTCAYDCYDPCRDKCEFDLICCLMERVNCLEVLLNDLYLQLECLEYQATCAPQLCKKPTCYNPCKPQCQKPCCAPRNRCRSCKPNVCRKSSVIPLGVMLVKL